MASTADIRVRRSAAQLEALAGVEREIRAQDSHNRRKYLREFNDAFRRYDSLLDSEQFQKALHPSDMVLIGDYHALPASQRFAASLVEQRAMTGDRPVVLGLETIFSRDQHILDEWWRREIEETELRQRIRFDLDWGYDWAPFYQLLVTAREHAEALYGLDCMPREDLRKISARDRHAAMKVAEIRHRHPNAVVFVLFGESHLAPGHLPRVLREQMPEIRVLTVLQNIDALYWRAAGEPSDKVDAVRINDDTVCVFNSTPLEKYESYRLFLDQWSRCDNGPDFAPTIYNLIDSLARFLDINRYSPHNSTQPKFLVDLMPEVYCSGSDAMLRRSLLRKGISEDDCAAMLAKVEERGCVYFPQVNAFYVREFQMIHAGEDATRFLHHACQGLPRRLDPQTSGRDASAKSTDVFYRRVVEHALAYFGSRVLYPARPACAGEDGMSFSRAACEKAALFSLRGDCDKLDSVALTWGNRLGTILYDAYLAGVVSQSNLRRLFLVHLDEPGVARKLCGAMITKARAFLRTGRV